MHRRLKNGTVTKKQIEEFGMKTTAKYKDLTLTGQYYSGNLKENSFICKGMLVLELDLRGYEQKCV